MIISANIIRIVGTQTQNKSTQIATVHCHFASDGSFIKKIFFLLLLVFFSILRSNYKWYKRSIAGLLLWTFSIRHHKTRRASANGTMTIYAKVASLIFHLLLCFFSARIIKEGSISSPHNGRGRWAMKKSDGKSVIKKVERVTQKKFYDKTTFHPKLSSNQRCANIIRSIKYSKLDLLSTTRWWGKPETWNHHASAVNSTARQQHSCRIWDERKKCEEEKKKRKIISYRILKSHIWIKSVFSPLLIFLYDDIWLWLFSRSPRSILSLLQRFTPFTGEHEKNNILRKHFFLSLSGWLALIFFIGNEINFSPTGMAQAKIEIMVPPH